jgi:polyisoprenoid-binding protein YceI
MKSAVLTLLTIIILAGVTYGLLTKSQIKNMNSTKNVSVSNLPMVGVDGTYNILTTKSSVRWTGGKKFIINYFDHGIISLKSAKAIFSESNLTGGEIVFDMKSISTVSTGINGGMDNLSKHLMSADFFDVEKYPESKYVITSVTKDDEGVLFLQGDLTIKEKTAPLSIPVSLSLEKDGTVKISGQASVDRSIWEVKYGSEKFFKGLGDKVINDIFTLDFDLIAQKQ